MNTSIKERKRNMEKLNTLKMTVMFTIGGIGGALAKLLGGWSEDLNTLLILMAVDFIMGLLIAAVWKKSGKSETGALNSISAWKREGCS